MTKPKPPTLVVYPVAGRFLLGVPAVAAEVEPDEAEALVASGAFSLTQSEEEPASVAAPEEPAPMAGPEEE